MRDVHTLLARVRGAEPLVQLNEIREEGVVRVIACVATGGQMVESPFTGENGICIRLQCRRRTVPSDEGNERGSLNLISDETIGEPFVVADDGGCAWVVPTGADLIATMANVSHHAGVGAKQTALRYLHERRLKVGLFVEQYVLRPGTRVELSGRVALERGEADGYRSVPSPRLAFISDAQSGAMLRIRVLA